MNILVANLGSTSFKYQLLRFEEDGASRVLSKGGYERVTDFEEVIEDALGKLVAEGFLASVEDLDVVGFKTVLGGRVSGCLPADDRVLQALDDTASLAPAHNPAYAAGIRAFEKRAPGTKRVALFETAFFQWLPEPARRYAVPESWYQAGIRRYGFHGASHKFIAERSAYLLGASDLSRGIEALYIDGPPIQGDIPIRVISCHLGGSSSVVGIRNGIAIGSSMGMTPQSGLPQNNRVGDLDSGAIPFATQHFGIDPGEAQRVLSQEGGLLGLSGISNDLRDIIEAAKGGNVRAKLARDFLVWSIRQYVGQFFMEMGGAEAIVFTGGIGENNPELRSAVLAGWDRFGVRLNEEQNAKAGGAEQEISLPGGTRVWVIPANEELVVAREAYRLVQSGRYVTLYQNTAVNS